MIPHPTPTAETVGRARDLHPSNFWNPVDPVKPKAGKKRRSNKERALCILIAKHVREMKKPGAWFGHWPNGGKFSAPTKRLMSAMGLVPGPPDYVAISPGGLHAIEVKLATSELFGTKKTYQSPEQKEFQKLWTAAGGFYAVVRSLDEAKAYLERHGITRPDRSFIPAKGREG